MTLKRVRTQLRRSVACQGPYTSLLALTDALQVAESKFANSGVDVTIWVQSLRREAIILTQNFCDLLGLVHCGINVITDTADRW